MILVLIIKILGRLLACLPERAVAALCYGIGTVLALLPTPRRRVGLSNLAHAFPDKPPHWHRRVFRESLRRLVEMTLLNLASMYFDANRVQHMIHVPEALQRLSHKLQQERRGVLLLAPHLSLLEILAFVPAHFPPEQKFGSLFRPFDNPHLNRLVQKTRERWGGTLISRKNALKEAFDMLNQGGRVIVFFDQNVGRRGALIPFFGRVASTSYLPGLLMKRCQVPVYMLYPHRTAFWRIELSIEAIPGPQTIENITVESHRCLESYLQRSEDNCSDWLWVHKRWKTQDNPRSRLQIQAKKQFYNEDDLKGEAFPIANRTRFWIYLPDNFSEAKQAVPLLKALRRSRPDAALTLLGQRAWLDQMATYDVADEYLGLPGSTLALFAQCWRWRRRYPDTAIVLNTALRSEIAMALTRAPQRFGLAYPGQKRPFLTHCQSLSAAAKTESGLDRHWQDGLRHFGLK